MAGVGGSVFCQLPPSIVSVLESDDGSVPCATRLACTLGPSSRSKAVIVDMLRAGMNIARFDFTGVADVAYHVESFQALKEAMAETNLLCAVMINPAGPDLHVLNRPEGAIQLRAGQTLRISNDANARASTTLLPINWPGDFTQGGLRPGSNIFVGQYLFTGAETSSAYLTVQKVEPNLLDCVVNNECSLEGALLTVKLDSTVRSPMPCLGPQDEAQLKQWAAAATNGSLAPGGAPLGALEFLALPRTRSVADVEECRAMLARVGLGHVKVVAKIEDMEGLVAHDAIVAASDAVIFSRGSLGTCLEPEKVNIAQRMMLRNCNQQGKPVFVTRVVDTMTEAPRPTRAEATDVANLVLDGADGILLGSETFRGKYPASVVHMVAAICRAAEAVFDNFAFYRAMTEHQESPANNALGGWDRAEALASSAVRAAHKMDAKLIVVFTVTGRTARLVAKYRPKQPMLTVVCTDPNAARFSDSNYMRSPAKATGANGGGGGSPVASAPLPGGLKKVASDTLLSLGQLSSWSHGHAAKACLVYRGALPIMVDAPPGSQQAGEVLEGVLEYAKAVGLVASGDRVVVSQCPRNMNSDVMSEGGVVQLVTVDHTFV